MCIRLHDAARTAALPVAVLAAAACVWCTPRYMTADLAEEIIRARCDRKSNIYLIRTGYIARHGAYSAEMERESPHYAALRKMGWITVEYRDGKPFVELTPAGLAHVDKEHESDPLRDKDLRCVRLADWQLIGIVSVKRKTITRSWRDDAPGVDVSYRWKWSPTATGRLFKEKGWPGGPLRQPIQMDGPLDTPIDATVELQRYEGGWDLSTPMEKGKGGLYVQ